MNCSESSTGPSAACRPAALIACMLILLACAWAPEPAQGAAKKRPEVLIKFATLAPDGSAWMKTMRALDVEIREATGGRVGFKFYTGGVQGDEKEVLRKIRNGQLHGGGFTGYGIGVIRGDFRVLELPFMFKSPEEVDFVRAEMDSTLRAMFEEQGMVLLGWADVGFVYLFSKEPITTPADLRQRKAWIWSGDPLAELFFSALDVSPIPLSVPDVLTSLQMGVIDAVYASPLACIAVQWYTRVRYMTDLPITYSIGAVLIAEKAVSRLSPGEMDILVASAARRLEELNAKTRRQNREAVELMKKEGIELAKVVPSSAASFERKSRSAWKRGIGKLYSRELLDEVVSILERCRNSSSRPAGEGPEEAEGGSGKEAP